MTKGNHNARSGFSYQPANYFIDNPNYTRGEFDFYLGFGIDGAPLEVGFTPGFLTLPFAGGTYKPLGLVTAAVGFCPVGSTYCIPASTAFSAPQTFALQVPYSFESATGNGR